MPLRKTALAFAFLAGSALTAFAGEQYVDSSGYAISGYDVVAYWDLDANPVGSAQPEAVRGKKQFTADYNGAKWAFSSAENRDRFVADPAKFVPEFDGHCAYGAAQGGKVPANPHLWRIVDGKLLSQHYQERRLVLGRRHSRQHFHRQRQLEERPGGQGFVAKRNPAI